MISAPNHAEELSTIDRECGRTALHWAVKLNFSMSTVIAFSSNFPQANSIVDFGGMCPITLAAEGEYYSEEFIIYMIQLIESVRHQLLMKLVILDRLTPLSPSIFEAILSKSPSEGGEWDFSNRMSCLDWAVVLKRSAGVVRVLANGFRISCGSDDENILRWHIRAGKRDCTVLTTAIDADCIDELLDSSDESSEGSDSLDNSVNETKKENDDVVLAIVETLPQLCQVRTGNELPLHMAIRKGRPIPVIKAIAEAHPQALRIASSDYVDTPLQLAIKNHYYWICRDSFSKVVHYLIEADISMLSVRCREGNLPFHNVHYFWTDQKLREIKESILELMWNISPGCVWAEGVNLHCENKSNFFVWTKDEISTRLRSEAMLHLSLLLKYYGPVYNEFRGENLAVVLKRRPMVAFNIFRRICGSSSAKDCIFDNNDLLRHIMKWV